MRNNIPKIYWHKGFKGWRIDSAEITDDMTTAQARRISELNGLAWRFCAQRNQKSIQDQSLVPVALAPASRRAAMQDVQDSW